MSLPLVSVICLCYNHEQFVEETVLSVINQTYEPIEIIIIDDASTDRSADVINDLKIQYPQLNIKLLNKNMGNTAAFNIGLSMATGEFVIDLATDDILLPNRVQLGIEAFQSADIGVNFTNAQYIDDEGNKLYYHYPIDKNGNALKRPSEGDIYKELVQRYFICSPTMMVKRAVLDELKGYDTSLAYEDFDFWVRSSRQYQYQYSDEVLVYRRLTTGSMSSKQYTRNSPQMESTLAVCKKIKKLNRNEEENRALKKRIWYESKQCIKYLNFKLLMKYFQLYLSL